MSKRLMMGLAALLMLATAVVGASVATEEPADAYGYSCFVSNPQVINEHVCGKIVSEPWAGGWFNTFHIQQLNSGTYHVIGYDQHYGATGWHQEIWSNQVDGGVRIAQYWTSQRPLKIKVEAHNPGWVNASWRTIFFG